MKFISTPTEIEATQFYAGESHPHVGLGVGVTGEHYFTIGKQGPVLVNPGDWIIAEPDGYGHYPCADAIFRAKYRLAETPGAKSPSEPKLTLAETTARVEANSNANRVSIPSIKARIASADYHDMGGTLTICIITMQNGFTFTGKSACADPANYDREVGQRYAYEDAFKQIWSHEAYLIRERLYLESIGHAPYKGGY